MQDDATTGPPSLDPSHGSSGTGGVTKFFEGAGCMGDAVEVSIAPGACVSGPSPADDDTNYYYTLSCWTDSSGTMAGSLSLFSTPACSGQPMWSLGSNEVDPDMGCLLYTLTLPTILLV